jgi:hypothetical protein
MRSYAWFELADTEQHPKSDWIRSFLIPELEKITGVKWDLQKRLIYSNDVTILEDVKNDPIVKAIRKKWPTCNVGDFGYKIYFDQWRTVRTDKFTGFWALDPKNIIERGGIIGKKFGL